MKNSIYELIEKLFKISASEYHLNKVNTDLSNLDNKIDTLNKTINILKNNSNNQNIPLHGELEIKKANELKDKHEKKLRNFIEELEVTEKKKLLLCTSPAYLACELKSLVENNKFTDAHNKLNELIVVVNEVPYVTESDKDFLEKQRKIFRKEYMDIQNRIKNNDYIGSKNAQLETRKKDLLNLNKFIEKEMDKLRIDIKKIDDTQIEQLANKVNTLVNNKELENEYNEDLNSLVEYTILVRNTSVKYLSTFKEKNDKNIVAINTELESKTNLYDEDKRLNDIKRIKEVASKLTYIENRIKHFDENIHTIKDEIDLILSSLEFDEEENTKFIPIREVINLDDDIPFKKLDDIIKLTEI